MNRKLLWGMVGMVWFDSEGRGPEKHKGRGSRLKGFQPESGSRVSGHSDPVMGSQVLL